MCKFILSIGYPFPTLLKFMVVCYRDLDSGEKFNAVGEKLCINCDCYLYGNIVSNQKYGEQFQTAYYERSKMGKSQKGKELGIGISQRKDGLYTGRVTDPRTGKRIQKYFHKLQECRKWVAETHPILVSIYQCFS